MYYKNNSLPFINFRSMKRRNRIELLSKKIIRYEKIRDRVDESKKKKYDALINRFINELKIISEGFNIKIIDKPRDPQFFSFDYSKDSDSEDVEDSFS